MGQVTVTVAGRLYRMACGDGEEARIEALARAFDGKITEFKGSIGDIGDMRLHVMAGLFFADEVEEVRRRLAAAEEKIAGLGVAERRTAAEQAEREESAAKALGEAARRIEGLARLMTSPIPEE